MKFLEKVRKLGKRAKLAISTAIATMSMAAIACVASAADPAETTGSSMNMGTVMKNAGDALISTMNDLVENMIPVVLGIASAGLVVFGIIGLIKLAKKIFGKVTG